MILADLLKECAGCGRFSCTSVVLHLWNADSVLRFCSMRCKTRYLDTHPSENGDLDPRFDSPWL